MKLNKATLLPMLATAVVTIGIITVINNVSQLATVKDTVNGNKGWF
ncbi:hypothetical protein [Vibrio vulnificus]|nr:hypothetical protein [Vibrio vulnificus]EHK2774216.1 hypothetical protein [Vibrio vulnificus]EHK9003779.1 hypothetical protein [Vibrio vulnificus]EHK9017222.1 hypothetical protein [Vibrio vulnificus]EHK9043173.1 hypothetical protein [Vibrio vulnificus]EHK9066060.1 hypothetical protein [Vibrio vulnificus]